MMWILVVCASFCELGFTVCMKLSDGFTKLCPTVWMVLGMLASFFFLSRAVHTLPMGTAYAVWTGIGALGAVLVGILIFREPVTAPRLLFMALLLIGIIGLKITSAE